MKTIQLLAQTYFHLPDSFGFVLLDNDMAKRSRCWYPFNNSAFLIKWNYGVRTDFWEEMLKTSSRSEMSTHIHTQLALARLGCTLKQFVDEIVKLQYSIVLAHIILGLAQEIISFSIASHYADFTRALKTIHHVNLVDESWR